MPSGAIEEIQGTSLKNMAFYNEISVEYDAILDKESSNEIVRKRVREKFTELVKPGHVLDFGGGTGRDLDWLIQHQYQVVFCEPSEGMRQKAIDRYKNSPSADRVTFLGNDQTDFTTWREQPPFSVKTDAILTDFAVINCIADIGLLFETFAQLIKPGGHLIVLMLNSRYKKTWRWKLREQIRSFVSGKPAVIHVQYNNYRQIVHLYSLKHIKAAASASFELRSHEDLFEFTLFHFIRK
ncbi:MAG TPA: class I SAM-dependent methyltransferase [Pedobacter sp.]